jgi:protein-disulfide isomerase
MKQLRWIGIAALVVLVIGAAAFWRNATSEPVDDLTGIMAENVDGAADAPVKIVEFGDFGCPSCRAWHNAGIKEQLKAEFGDQISFTFRHFPVITAQSPKAAEAAQCAAEQDAFWQYHDYLYEQVPGGALGQSDLKQYATAIGLDQAAFESCLDSGKYGEYVSRDRQAAVDAGARGTPSFFVNGRPVAPFLEAMSAQIQVELGG